jgi:hypothetical protein
MLDIAKRVIFSVSFSQRTRNDGGAVHCFRTNASASSHDEKLPWFAQVANAVSRQRGKPGTFALCCLLIVAWAATGQYLHFSENAHLPPLKYEER